MQLWVLLSGTQLTEWVSNSVPLNSTFPASIFQSLPHSDSLPSTAILFKGSLPAFPEGTAVNDTFLLLKGWTKGIAFVNGINVGRYWPVEPPQKTLYVPSSALRAEPRSNEVVIFEQDQSPCQPPNYESCYITFVNKPIFDWVICGIAWWWREYFILCTVYLVCQLANSKRMHPNNLHAVVLSARKTLCVLQYYSTQDKSASVVYQLSAFVTTFIPLLCSCNMLG